MYCYKDIQWVDLHRLGFLLGARAGRKPCPFSVSASFSWTKSLKSFKVVSLPISETTGGGATLDALLPQHDYDEPPFSQVLR
jgi:hypothetical protein